MVCGVHGNEERSLECYEYFQRKPLARTEVILGNPPACADGRRYTLGGQNLNTCFPGDTESPVYERRRASELMRWAAKFDIVIDIHGNPAPDSDCIFMRPEASLTLRGLTSCLNIPRIVVSTAPSLAGSLEHVASIDLGTNSTVWPRYLHAMVEDLTLGAQWYPPCELEWYSFVGNITKAQAAHTGPPVPCFGPLPDELATTLGVSPEYRALFWDDDPSNPYLFELAQPSHDPWRLRSPQTTSA